MPGDLVKSINGNNLDGKSLLEAATIIRSVQDNAKVDVPVTLEVVRNGQTIYFLVNPAAAKRKTIRVAIDPNASPAARALGEQWLATKTPEVQ
jgi:intracellular sulfur oxidation DsrE/DsrF family protein